MTNLTEINCKDIFRNAYENRYTWDSDFDGYRGKCKLLIDKKNMYEGSFSLGKNLKPDIRDINDVGITKSISSQLFEVAIHRVKRDFQSIHSQNHFHLIKSSESGVEMKVSGKNDGDRYRVKNKCINMVYRKIHGVIIEIFIDEFLDTGVGFLSKKYTSQQINLETLKANSQKLEYEDQFINVGARNYWLLNSRTIKYINKNKEQEIQKYIFEDLHLLN